MNTALYIPKFDERHTNAELSRKPGSVWHWVRMPTSLDSLSLRRLMSTKSGVAAFGVYCLLVEIAANGHPKGTLANGRGPMNITDLSIKTGAPEKILQEGIDMLLSPDIGWLKEVDPESTAGLLESTSGIPPVYSSQPTNSNSNSNSSEGDARGGLTLAGFDEFWAGVPHRIGKLKARKAYGQALTQATHDEIMAGLPAYHASEQRRKTRDRDGFQPLHPTTWLHEGRWMDEQSKPGQTPKSGLAALTEAERRSLHAYAAKLDPSIAAYPPGADDCKPVMLRHLAAWKGSQ